MSTFPSQKRFPKRSVFPFIPPAARGRGATCSQTAEKEGHLPGERRTPKRRLISSLLQQNCPGTRRRLSPRPPPGRTPSRTAPGRNAESRSQGHGTGAAGLPRTPTRGPPDGAGRGSMRRGSRLPAPPRRRHSLEGENAEGPVGLVAGVLGHALAPEVVGEGGGHGGDRPHVGVVHDGPDVVVHELAPQGVAVAEGAQPRQHRRRSRRRAAPPARRRAGGRRGSVPAAGAPRRARHHGAGRRAGCPGSAAAAACGGSGACMVRGGNGTAAGHSRSAEAQPARLHISSGRPPAPSLPSCSSSSSPPHPPRVPSRTHAPCRAVTLPPPPQPVGGVGSAGGGPAALRGGGRGPARQHPRKAVSPRAGSAAGRGAQSRCGGPAAAVPALSARRRVKGWPAACCQRRLRTPRAAPLWTVLTWSCQRAPQHPLCSAASTECMPIRYRCCCTASTLLHGISAGPRPPRCGIGYAERFPLCPAGGKGILVPQNLFSLLWSISCPSSKIT